MQRKEAADGHRAEQLEEAEAPEKALAAAKQAELTAEMDRILDAESPFDILDVSTHIAFSCNMSSSLSNCTALAASCGDITSAVVCLHDMMATADTRAPTMRTTGHLHLVLLRCRCQRMPATAQSTTAARGC